MTPDQRRDVLKRLNSTSMFRANDAARAILKDPDHALIPGVIETLRLGERICNRIEAAYALQFLRGTVRTIVALERSLSNKSENPTVRGFAAESLTFNHRQLSHSVLLRNLNDTPSEVRFWCAYALGEMHDRKALPELRCLAMNDHRVVKGWWKVSKEAKDAIKKIEGTRKRKCIFCRL